jgi:glycosyltransferase involved in cell wall biosynthesis
MNPTAGQPEAKPIKIGYVTRQYPCFSETFIAAEILELERNGIDIQIYSLSPPTDPKFQRTITQIRADVLYVYPSQWNTDMLTSLVFRAMHEFPVLARCLDVFQKAGSLALYHSVILARYARDFGCTHLHAHFANAPATAARLASRLLGISYSLTAHAYDIYSTSANQSELNDNMTEAKAVVTVSQANVDFLQATIPGSVGRTNLVYNGINLDDLPYQSPAVRENRIVAVGRLVEKKGFPLLIDACASLVKKGMNVECFIIGGGPQGHLLWDTIRKLDLTNVVHLLGPIGHPELFRYMQSAAVLAVPSIITADGNREGLPTVLLEAMALGTPCVGARISGIPEALLDGQTGMIVEPGDAEGLATAISSLLTDSHLRIHIAEQARRRIETHFNIKSNCARLRHIFGESASNQTPIS